jgi:hypothetical protein
MERNPDAPCAPVLRVARPTRQLAALADLYVRGLDFEVIGAFEDHDGYDGVILGHPGHPYHLEFTHRRGHTIAATPDPEQLLVLYLPDRDAWSRACTRMQAAGFRPVVACNPYWERQGRTFEDLDGYRVVLQNATWER